MANTKTAKKNILINKRNRTRNLQFKTRMRNAIKNARLAIVGKLDTAKELVKDTLRTIDKTASKGVIKKQTAARLKSNLAMLLNNTLSGKIQTATAAPKAKKKTTSTKAKKAVKKAAKGE